jgi:hypothetical protein
VAVHFGTETGYLDRMARFAQAVRDDQEPTGA